MERGYKNLIENLTASNTANVPTGTSIGNDPHTFVLPTNIKDLSISCMLTDGGGADVDVKIHALPIDNSGWHELAMFALNNLESETQDRYDPIFTDAWLYSAIFVEIVVNAGTASVDVNALYTFGR